MLFKNFNRIVVKVGSALLVDKDTGQIKSPWMHSLADDIAQLKDQGKDVIVVSSGAIAMGRGKLALPANVRELDLPSSQAAASIGQIQLAYAWAQCLEVHGMMAGQILLTKADTLNGQSTINAKATLNTLLSNRAVPVINENDTTATHEIRYGDNDTLAADVARIADADLLILLSDIDGLYTQAPHKAGAQHIAVVESITPEIEKMAEGPANLFSKGGMTTKIEAGKLAAAANCAMIIAKGEAMHPVRAIENGARHTFFKAQEKLGISRKVAAALVP